jgi:hypothetical protein
MPARPANPEGEFMRRVLAFVLSSALLALFGASVAAASGIAGIQISQDIYVNPDSQHKTQVEPDSYAFGSTIVAVFQSGRFFSGGGSSNVGWSVSKDAGATWTPGFLPGTTDKAIPPGPYSRDTDPSVAYDLKHNVWLANTLAIKPNGINDILVNRSTDGGLTFGTPLIVAAGPAGSFYDKNWITCDTNASSPFFGNCYVQWDDAASGNLMLMSTSTDGGLTWGPPKTTANVERGVLGGQPVVLNSGTVVVTYDHFTTGQVKAFTSTNGGQTWNTPVVVSNRIYHVPAGGIRAPFLPSSEARTLGPGPVVVVWPDCRFEMNCSANDIVISSSVDGVTWTAPARIPIDPIGSGIDHFIPGIAVQPQGTTRSTATHLALGYYYYSNSNCSSATCQLNVGAVFSTNGGGSWSAPQQLAGPMMLSWLANTDQGRMVGDYISTSYSGNNAFPIYASATAPVGGIFNENMFTTPVAAGSLIGGRPASSAGAHPFAPQHQPAGPRVTAQ